MFVLISLNDNYNKICKENIHLLFKYLRVYHLLILVISYYSFTTLVQMLSIELILNIKPRSFL